MLIQCLNNPFIASILAMLLSFILMTVRENDKSFDIQKHRRKIKLSILVGIAVTLLMNMEMSISKPSKMSSPINIPSNMMNKNILNNNSLPYDIFVDYR